GEGQIQLTVTVEVGDYEVIGAFRDGVVDGRLERAIAVTQQDRDAGGWSARGIGVGTAEHSVDEAVVVEVPGSQILGVVGGGEQTRAAKPGQIATCREGQLGVKQNGCKKDS